MVIGGEVRLVKGVGDAVGEGRIGVLGGWGSGGEMEGWKEFGKEVMGVGGEGGSGGVERGVVGGGVVGGRGRDEVLEEGVEEGKKVKRGMVEGLGMGWKGMMMGRLVMVCW